MIINDREITIVKYSTVDNWISDIPISNWLCLLVDNDYQRNYLDEVISKVINNDVCYFCTVGHSCERTHVLIDEELVFREVDIEKLHLPEHQIKTSFHTDFDEGVRFTIFGASHEAVSIDKIVILDMTNGNELSRINKLLTEFKLTGQKNGR